MRFLLLLAAIHAANAAAQYPGAMGHASMAAPGMHRSQLPGAGSTGMRETAAAGMHAAAEQPQLPEGWIDAHIHLRAADGNYASALHAAEHVMERAGIATSIVMPQPFDDGAQNANKHEYESFLSGVRASGGHIAFLGGGGSLNGMIQRAGREGSVSPELQQAFDAQAEKIVRDGAAGFGEIAVLHLSHFPGHPYEAVPADHPLLLRLADIAARNDLVLDIHMDMLEHDEPLPSDLSSPPNPPTLQADLPAFERLLEHNPKAKIVLAHCGWDATGQWTTQLSRRLLGAHPNLYMSIKIGQGGAREHNPLLHEGVKPDWLALLRDFADRFVIGSDSFYAAPGSSGAGTQVQINGVGALLARLPRELALKVGYENAKRIYRLQ
jgi:predicted TIM-barrel fold metal-dependent hydrolase